MLQFLILLIILVALIIIIGTPILVFRGYNKLKIKGYKKAANFFALIFIFINAFTGYEIIGAVYPYDDWYKENFQINSGMDFPKNGKIIYKDAGFPDIHGHFISACSFELGPESFKQFSKAFQGNSSYCNCGSDEIYDIMRHYNKNDINQVYKKADGNSSIYLMFLNDNKTIIYFFFCGIYTGC